VNRKKIQQASGKSGGSAEWLTTFNDLVTLLMVFFVLLFTMGSMDNKKMDHFQSALQSGLGILQEGNKVSIGIRNPQPIKDMSHVSTQAEGDKDGEGKEKKEARKALDKAIQEFDENLGVKAMYTEQGARILFEDDLLFNFGNARINKKGFLVLDNIAAVLEKMPFPVRVEGHTDNAPIRTRQYPSNWELSIARAVNVVKYFAETRKISPERLSAVGYGESRPVAANDSPANCAKNRRVEIVLLTEDKS